MPKPVKGPRGHQIAFEHLPIAKLQEILPENSPLDDSITGTIADQARQTGMVLAIDAGHGMEPWFFDESHMVLLADTNPGPDSLNYSAPPELLLHMGTTYLFSMTDVLVPGPPFGIGYHFTAHIGTVDPETGLVTNILDLDRTLLNDPTEVDGKIYLVATNQVGDFYVNSGSLQVFNPINNHLSEVDVPSEFGTLGESGHHLVEANGELFINGATTAGYDLLRYNPANGAWAGYAVPGTQWIPDLTVAAGKVWMITLGEPGPGYANPPPNLYSVDLTTGTVSLALSGVSSMVDMGEDIIVSSASYDPVSSTYTTTLHKIEGTSGVVEQVLQVQANGWLRLAGAGENEVFFAKQVVGDNDMWTIVDNADNSTSATLRELTAYSLDLSSGPGFVVDGTLYIEAAATQGSPMGIYALQPTSGMLQNIAIGWENANVTDANPQLFGVINDHLLVTGDYDHDGDRELWSSPTPMFSASWVNITPEGLDVPYNFPTIYQGDFIL